MFEYSKLLLEDRIDNNIYECNKKREKLEELENEVLYINDYERVLFDIKCDKFGIIIYTILTIVAVLLSTLASGIIIGINIFHLASILALFKTFQSILQLKSHNSIMKEDINKDYLTLNKEELELKKAEIKEELSLVRKEINTISNEIIDDQNTLKYFNNYESAHEFLNSPEGILATASTQEEMVKLHVIQQKCKNISLSSWLDEKVIYPNIHFDNSINENINYTNNKKLVKKL